MNPLSPFTYYCRHKRSVLLLVALIALVTLGLYVMVGVLDSFMEHVQAGFNYLTRFSFTSSSEPAVASQVRAHPDIAHVFPETSLNIQVPMLFGTSAFRVMGVHEADLPVLMEMCDVRLKEGRLLEPRTNEIMLSEGIARALGLRVGDQIGRSINERYYGGIPTELVLVGILESDPSVDTKPNVRVAIVSYEYLDGHELYGPRSPSLIVVPREGRKAAVDDFLETLRSEHTSVVTYEREIEFFARAQQMFYLVFGVVDCLVAVVVALVVGVINRIALTQRLAEVGLLHALGHHKNRLVRRLTLEVASVAGMGWIGGLVLSGLIFAWLKFNLYEPRGTELNLANPTPFWFTIPVPLVVIAFAAFSITRMFARLDAVAIVERGELSMEARNHRRAVRRSSARPLSLYTFYLRHRRRGLILVVATALMTLGVAFPVFLMSSMSDAQGSVFLSYLRQASIVSPAAYRTLDPGVTAQIRTHPAVARVIPAKSLSLWISVPPVGEMTIAIYGVSEDDLPFLVDLYGMSLKEGRLPRVRSNEIVLSKSAALNRGLRVGDTVGRPAQEEDDTPTMLQDGIPTEMEIVGILSPGGQWMGFASYEYLESHELYSSQRVSLLVVPAEGRRAELDGWLEENVASTQTIVRTYDAQLRETQQGTRGMLLMFAALEGIIAVVAAIALAALNYIFFAQRREEFGILHAMGHSRLWLVLRTVGETVSTVAVAWLIGAAVCVTGLVYAQVNVYAPKGLSLDFFSLSPWLFTLPIPLAVVAASAGTIAWMLSKLDPVSIIERR